MRGKMIADISIIIPVLHFPIVPGHSGKNANVPAIIFAWGGADSIKIVIVYHSKLLNSH